MNSNFQGGRTVASDKPLRMEDAAERHRMDEGWRCVRCKRFWGDDERLARRCCANDEPCGIDGCTNRKGRHRLYCDSCWLRLRHEMWKNLEQREPWASGEKMALCPWDGDDYFFDSESLIEHCHTHAIRPSDLDLVFARPHYGRIFELSEYLSDDLFEDDFPFDAAEVKRVEASVNALIRSAGPLCYFQEHKVRPTTAAVAEFDRLYDKECADDERFMNQ